MRPITLMIATMAGLATVAEAQTVTYYLHQSPSPVAIPGGTTTFVLDANPPTATTPAVQAASVPKKTTATLASFVAPTFAAPTTIGLDFDVIVNLSANLTIDACAFVGVTIERVDAAGVHTVVARGSVQAATPQGGAGGTVGFAPTSVPVSIGCDRPTDDVTIDAGESIAVTVSLTNLCRANRTVWLAYDATSAPDDATFAPTLPPSEVFVRACYAKCEYGTSKAIAKFVASKDRCVLRCQANARRGITPSADCYPPFGGATLACIEDPLKGAATKTAASIRHVCPAPGRCPPCYSGGDCNLHADETVADVESEFDSFVPAIYCELSAVPATAKCADTTAKWLSKLFAGQEKCYDKCFKNESRGIAAPDSCLPPTPSDVPTAACLSIVTSRTAASIDAGCATAPACWGGITGTQWTNLMSLFAATAIPTTYCGS